MSARLRRGPGRRRATLAGVAIGLGLMAAPPAVAQTPPSNLAGTGVSGSSIQLTWTGSGALATYNVYRDSALVASGLGSESYTDTGLASFTEYEYYVTATVFGSESDPSNAVKSRTLDDSPPTRPDILSATGVSTTQIDLTWSPSTDPETGVSEYVVYREGVEIVRTAATGYSDVGLSPSTTYTYRVTAVNGDGYESSPSGPRNASTLDPVPPPPPTGLGATPVSASRIDLSWTAAAADDLIGYRVYRDGSPIADLGLVTSYEDSGLQGYTTYTYTVTALDDEGLESDPSESAAARTLDGTPPTVPTGLSAQSAGTTTITLTWNASTDPESGVALYRIFRDGVEVGSTAQTSFEDAGLAPATTYGYRVSAENGEGLESGLSTQASATTGDASPPTTPTGLVATAAGTDRIDLTWSPSADPESGILGYRVFRGNSEVGQTAQTGFTDTGLSPATEYTYRVVAVNGDGLESAPSDPASATTRDASPPTPPGDLVATPVGTERIDLSWSASDDLESGIAGYLVFRDGSEVGTTTQTVYQDGGLEPGTTYDYYVVALNGDGLESQPSAGASARTFDGTGPTTPTDLAAEAVGTDRIDLSWTAAEDPESGIAAYKIFRDGLEIATTGETTYSDTDLSPATTYEYRVSAVNGDGLQGSLSVPASATTADASGPTAPGNLTAEAVGQTQINLTWTASEDPETGVDRYIVYRNDEMIGSVPGTSFADTGLVQNTTYTYAITAVNGEEIEGQRSQSVSATTFPSEDQIPPAPPTQLRVVAQ